MACAGPGAPRPTRPWARPFGGGGGGAPLSPIGASWCCRVGPVTGPGVRTQRAPASLAEWHLHGLATSNATSAVYSASCSDFTHLPK